MKVGLLNLGLISIGTNTHLNPDIGFRFRESVFVLGSDWFTIPFSRPISLLNCNWKSIRTGNDSTKGFRFSKSVLQCGICFVDSTNNRCNEGIGSIVCYWYRTYVDRLRGFRFR